MMDFFRFFIAISRVLKRFRNSYSLIIIYFRGLLPSGMLRSDQRWSACRTLLDGKHNNDIGGLEPLRAYTVGLKMVDVSLRMVVEWGRALLKSAGSEKIGATRTYVPPAVAPAAPITTPLSRNIIIVCMLFFKYKLSLYSGTELHIVFIFRDVVAYDPYIPGLGGKWSLYSGTEWEIVCIFRDRVENDYFVPGQWQIWSSFFRDSGKWFLYSGTVENCSYRFRDCGKWPLYS